MSNQNTTNSGDATFVKYALVVALIVLAFLMSFQFARGGSNPQAPIDAQAEAPAAGCGSGAEGATCPGCPTQAGETIEGAATLGADGVQRISVDVSTGFDPNLIKLAAGVPAEITFGQGAGCFAEVMSRDLGFFQDLTSGPKTINLPALEPGTYEFACGMEMVFGSIVVE